MSVILFSTFFLILILTGSDIIIRGSTYGLILWYQKLVPMLLPFMLISSILAKKVIFSVKSQKKDSPFKLLATNMIIGFSCGYPIGCKVTSAFYQAGLYSKLQAYFIIPICNNASPMFISGYIYNNLFCKTIPLYLIFFVIYLPQILIFCITYFFFSRKSSLTPVLSKNYPDDSEKNIIMGSITQLLYIGVYVMLCSIISEFIISMPISSGIKSLTVANLEITRGTDYLLRTSFSLKKKIALILSATSLGGLSAILQTNMILKENGLSVIPYIVIKTIGSFVSYVMALLLI